MPKSQKGFAPIILILFAAVGIIAYFFISSTALFKDKFFSNLYPKPSSKASEPIEISVVDPNATFYGTYQSHNQKIVSNQYGIFMTYLHQTNNQDTGSESSTWRLVRSTDSGKTFSTIYESTHGTRAPALETDSSGNIYLIHPDWATPSPTPSPTPVPSCMPRPSCLDATPACLRLEPIEGWCPNPSPTPSTDACLSDCNQCITKTTCGITTYDTCIDNLGQIGVNLCRNSASGFHCYSSVNNNCQSAPQNTFNYSCSTCTTQTGVLATTNDLKSYFYRFLASNNFQNPQISTIPTLGTFLAAKFAAELDEARGQLYYFTINDTFTIIGIDGTVKKQYLLTKAGTSAVMQYPYLYLDENGTLFVAWTTSNDSIYKSIHFILSKDGGLTWEKPNGEKLTLPIIADETGPTDRINLDDELNANSWLSTFLVKNGKVHFMYYARAPLDRQHYVRYDLATSKVDLNLYPEFKGETISLAGLDGICATAKNSSQIYCVNRAKSPYAVALLRSDDNGASWHDHALAPQAQFEIYALGGSPQITDDGYIIGSYTESNFSDPASPRVVKFFKSKISTPAPTPTATPTPTPTSTQTPTSVTQLSGSCPSPGTKANLSWTSVSSATNYLIRVNNKANPWSGSCTNVNVGDLCGSSKTASFTFTSIAGTTYDWWIHACNSNGCSSGVHASLTCAKS